jgi:dTDP-3,4-didehydro-2,6-dideoxy-alpha-D-glucose 3-reductase
MGCADIAWRAMIPAFIDCDDVSLVAVASRSKMKAEKFGAHFGCEGLVGYESLLSREDVEAIYMPLPTGLHEEWVRKTIEAGKHILVEKSFAENFESARSLVGLAQENNCLIVENFLFPHHSQHAWVMDKVASSEIGDMHLFRSTFGFPPFSETNFRYNPALGGGALLDVGAYVVKAAQIFLGSDLKLLGATLKYDEKTGVDIYGDAMLKNSKGQVAQISFGFDLHYQCNYELLGTKGKLVVERAFTPPPDFQPSVRLEHQGNMTSLSLPADNHYLNMSHFFANSVRDKSVWSGHWDSLLNQAKWIDAIRKEGM